MAMGLPTVAFETPVSREYLQEEGIYATPGDAVSLAEALSRGLFDPENQRRRVALRHKALDTYSWDCAAETILQAYEAVCHSKPTVI
jgi:glycosyltransferase involved in cell wall biosynthesis